MDYCNNPKYFTKKELLLNAELNQFTDIRPVEKYLWDCEIACLLQRQNDKIVLKGGAAVQLHLPLELQRASIDIDLISPISEEDFEQILDEITSDEKYNYSIYEPKNPTENLPLKTYIIETLNIMDTDGDPTTIKIDMLFDDCELPTETVYNIETFALEVNKLIIYKKTILMGDKILTLAENSIGVKDLGNYPKQSYDVYNLLKNTEITEQSLEEIIHTILTLSKKEINYRKYGGDEKDVMKDIIQSLTVHSSLDTAKYQGEMKKHIEGFQAYYLSSQQRRARLYTWSHRFNTIKFLATIILRILNEEITTYDGASIYNKAIQIEKKLSQIKGDAIKTTIKTLLGFADYLPYFKELRGKPIIRVYWEVITIENIEEIETKCVI